MRSEARWLGISPQYRVLRTVRVLLRAVQTNHLNSPRTKTMAPFSHHFRKSRYALLKTSDDGSKEETNGPSPESRPATPWSTFQVRLLLLLSSALSITIGLAVGYLAHQPRYSGPLGTSPDQLVRPTADNQSS